MNFDTKNLNFDIKKLKFRHKKHKFRHKNIKFQHFEVECSVSGEILREAGTEPPWIYSAGKRNLQIT